MTIPTSVPAPANLGSSQNPRTWYNNRGGYLVKSVYTPSNPNCHSHFYPLFPATEKNPSKQ